MFKLSSYNYGVQAAAAVDSCAFYVRLLPWCQQKSIHENLDCVREAWAKLLRINGIFTTEKPRKKGGEPEVLSNCCRLMMHLEYLQVLVWC